MATRVWYMVALSAKLVTILGAALYRKNRPSSPLHPPGFFSYIYIYKSPPQVSPPIKRALITDDDIQSKGNVPLCSKIIQLLYSVSNSKYVSRARDWSHLRDNRFVSRFREKWIRIYRIYGGESGTGWFIGSFVQAVLTKRHEPRGVNRPQRLDYELDDDKRTERVDATMVTCGVPRNRISQVFIHSLVEHPCRAQGLSSILEAR